VLLLIIFLFNNLVSSRTRTRSYKFNGHVYSKYHYPLANAKVILGIGKGNRDEDYYVATCTANDGFFELVGSMRKRLKVMSLIAKSDSGYYSKIPPDPYHAEALEIIVKPH
jgi:hypothetical protein